MSVAPITRYRVFTGILKVLLVDNRHLAVIRSNSHRRAIHSDHCKATQLSVGHRVFRLVIRHSSKVLQQNSNTRRKDAILLATSLPNRVRMYPILLQDSNKYPGKHNHRFKANTDPATRHRTTPDSIRHKLDDRVFHLSNNRLSRTRKMENNGDLNRGSILD